VVTNTFALIYRKNVDEQLMLEMQESGSNSAVSGRSNLASDHETSPKCESASAQVVTLDMVLTNGEALDLLMHHLEREYCMELLLSYIELDQFQKYVSKTADEFLLKNMVEPPVPVLAVHVSPLQRLARTPEKVAATARTETIPETQTAGYDEEQKGTKRGHAEPGLRMSDLQSIANLDMNFIETMPNIPRSQIITEMCSTDHNLPRAHMLMTIDQTTMHEIKKKAHLLYNKYVKCGSPFEVNVSYGIRTALQNKLDDKEKLMMDETVRLADLIQVFDEVKWTMKKLLRSPFRRMTLGPDNDKLRMLFYPETQIITSRT